MSIVLTSVLIAGVIALWAFVSAYTLKSNRKKIPGQNTTKDQGSKLHLSLFAHEFLGAQTLRDVQAISENYVAQQFNAQKLKFIFVSTSVHFDSFFSSACLDAITLHFKNTPTSIQVSSLADSPQTSLQDCAKALSAIDIDFLVPLFAVNNHMAIIGLRLGRTLNTVEHDKLEGFGFELLLAISNIQLHRKMMRFHSLVKEITNTRKIHLSMVPTELTGELDNFFWCGHIASAYKPGSDFWEVYPIDRGRILICMGEAKSETLAGSMLAAVVKSCCDQVLTTLSMISSPAAVLEILNSSLYRENSTARASCVVLIMDPNENTVTYANASHTAPFNMRKQDGKIEVNQLDSYGPLLGVKKTPGYQDYSSPLLKEDSIIFMSNGLLTPRNKEGEIFGQARLVELLQRQRTTDVEWVSGQIRSEITLHSHDESLRQDQALLIVGYEK